MTGIVTGLVMKISIKDSGTLALSLIAKNTATNIWPGRGIIEQKSPMAVARAMDVRLICHNSRRSRRLPKRSNPLTRIKRDGLGKYFRNERFGMTLTQNSYLRSFASKELTKRPMKYLSSQQAWTLQFHLLIMLGRQPVCQLQDTKNYEHLHEITMRYWYIALSAFPHYSSHPLAL